MTTSTQLAPKVTKPNALTPTTGRPPLLTACHHRWETTETVHKSSDHMCAVQQCTVCGKVAYRRNFFDWENAIPRLLVTAVATLVAIGLLNLLLYVIGIKE